MLAKVNTRELPEPEADEGWGFHKGASLYFVLRVVCKQKGCERVKSKPSYIMQSGEKGSVVSPEDAPATGIGAKP